MHSNQIVDTDRPTPAVRTFKWLLFAVEIFLLWVLCNTLFLVPGPYRGDRGIIIAVSTVLAAVVAWTSGRLFQRPSPDGSRSLGKTFSSPPVVICIFVLAVASIVMAVAILGTR
jgi:MFS superfamily sulfate permease-like transporter